MAGSAISASNGSGLDREELAARLREAEETLHAIRMGEVDAVVVGGPCGQKVYTLENADRPYRVLIEQMQEGAITLSAVGTILYCNDRFAEIVEVSRDGLIGSDFARFVADDHAGTLREVFSKADQANAVAELVLTTTGGRRIPVNISFVPLRGEQGEARVVCGVVTDLTLVKRRGDELALANAQLATEVEERRRVQGSLQLALDAARMGSWDLDLQQNIAERSLRHDQLFGYAKMLPNWTLDTALDHFVEDDRGAVSEAFSISRETGKLDFEARIRRADDGSIRWLRVTGQTFYDGAKPVRIAGVVADVTDRRAVEDRLRQTQKIEAIGQLTGGVAHDFNNLLMVISGGLEMIDRQADPARRERILTGMRRAVQRGSALSRQLLAFSRQQDLRPEPINLARQIGAMQELLDRSLRGDVYVETEFQADLWPVEVDPGELELVVLNLAVNARDAMPGGGTITIRGENAPALDDEEFHGDFVRLSVIDTGIGMTPSVIARVFEPYFTTKDIGKGSGLGLAQVHGFAQASGGGIRIESQPGSGTKICLILPRSSNTPAESSNEPLAQVDESRPPAGSAGNVLLVEDDNEVAALTGELIEELGYRAIRVASAEAALGALAGGCVVDLVFSDIMMPGTINGVGLAREIAGCRPGTPVLLTSGYAEAAKKSAGAEGVAILPKPYGIDDLAKAFALALRVA